MSASALGIVQGLHVSDLLTWISFTSLINSSGTLRPLLERRPRSPSQLPTTLCWSSWPGVGCADAGRVALPPSRPPPPFQAMAASGLSPPPCDRDWPLVLPSRRSSEPPRRRFGASEECSGASVGARPVQGPEPLLTLRPLPSGV